MNLLDSPSKPYLNPFPDTPGRQKCKDAALINFVYN